MTNYIIEVSLLHVILSLGYWFLLSEERQYTKMRFYLIGSIFLTLIIPLFKLPRLIFASEEGLHANPIDAIPLDAVVATTSTADAPLWNYPLFTFIYATITAFFLIKLLSGTLYLMYLKSKCSFEKLNGLYIYKSKSIKGSFTYFNQIFVNDEFDTNQEGYRLILKHEKAHVTLGHSYDLLLLESFKALFWLLPTSWYALNEVKKVHEFQADALALKECDVEQYSSVLITSFLKSHGFCLASSFNEGFIVKRLKVMKQNAQNIAWWRLGSIVTLCVLVFVVFACNEEPYNTKHEVENLAYETNAKAKDQAFFIVEEQPEFEGGMPAFYSYVLAEIEYPLQALQAGVEGRVDVQFVVEKDGSLTNVKAIKGIGSGCDSEAVRVVENAPLFNPGVQRGKPVRVQMVVPINFKINHSKTNKISSSKGGIVVEEVHLNKGKLKVTSNFANDEWYGTVFDPEGEKLPGVNIVLKGTNRGTVSDLNGNYKITAKDSDMLFFSFVGYETVKIGR